MGGRGSGSGLSFNVPSGGEGHFSDGLMERLPNSIAEAVGVKGAAKSISNAMEKANPFYSNSYSEYSQNCQRCVIAYELRRRGYDVEAQPTYKGDKWPNTITLNGQRLGRWRGAFRHAKTDNVGVNGNSAKAEAKVLSNITNKMKAYGSGARAVVNIGYRGSHVGHVFNVENQNGRIRFVDAQNGHAYNKASMRNLMSIVNTNSVGLTRTDNLKLSGRVTNFVWPNHKTRNK